MDDSDDDGLIYMRARYYDPEIGRFISRDPIASTNNLYEYCGNDPINSVDITGLCEINIMNLMALIGSNSWVEVEVLIDRLMSTEAGRKALNKALTGEAAAGLRNQLKNMLKVKVNSPIAVPSSATAKLKAFGEIVGKVLFAFDVGWEIGSAINKGGSALEIAAEAAKGVGSTAVGSLTSIPGAAIGLFVGGLPGSIAGGTAAYNMGYNETGSAIDWWRK